MEEGKRPPEDAPLRTNGGVKHAKRARSGEKSTGCPRERKDGDGKRGAGLGAARTPLVVEKRGQEMVMDVEEELMRALEEDIEAQSTAVVRATGAAPVKEDDDYDESEDEEGNEDKAGEGNTS